MSNYDIPNGAESLGEKDTDFEIGGTVELPPIPAIDNIRYELNQGNSLHCTLYGPMGAISDLFNYQFSQKDIDAVIKLSVERGKPLNRGRDTNSGVKCVCDYRNSINENSPENKVIYYKIGVQDILFSEALKKNYSIVVTYRGNTPYNNDVYDDANVEGVSFKPPTYGHCVRSIWLDGNAICDNYSGRKGKGGIATNQYKLSDLDKLVDNGVYYPSAYIIIPVQTKTKEDIKRLQMMKSLLGQKMIINEQLRHASNDTHYRDELTQEDNISKSKIEDILNEIKKL